MWFLLKITVSLLVVITIVESKAIDAKTNPCNENEYLNPIFNNCSALLGGGEAMYIDESKRCVNGFVGVKPYPDNDKFYFMCEADFVVLANCPNNLRFNMKTSKCETMLPCNLAQMPICSASGRFPVEQNSSCFYVCDRVGSEPSIMQCPGTSLYSPAIKRCSFSCKTPPTEVLDESSIETDESSNDLGEQGTFPACTKPGKFRVPTDCSKYYSCSMKSNGRFYQNRYKCPDAFYYDNQAGNCKPSGEVSCEMMKVIEIISLYDFYRKQRCEVINEDDESIKQCINASNEPNTTTNIPETTKQTEISSTTTEQIQKAATTPTSKESKTTSEPKIELSSTTSFYPRLLTTDSVEYHDDYRTKNDDNQSGQDRDLSYDDDDDDDDDMKLLSQDTSLRKRKGKPTKEVSSSTVTPEDDKTTPSDEDDMNNPNVGSVQKPSENESRITDNTTAESTTPETDVTEIISTESIDDSSQSADILGAISTMSSDDDYDASVGPSDDLLTTTSTEYTDSSSEPLTTTATTTNSNVANDKEILNSTDQNIALPYSKNDTTTSSSVETESTIASTFSTTDSDVSTTTEKPTKTTDSLETTSTTVESNDVRTEVNEKTTESTVLNPTESTVLNTTDITSATKEPTSSIATTTLPTTQTTIDDLLQKVTTTEQSTTLTTSTEVEQSSTTETMESTSTTVPTTTTKNVDSTQNENISKATEENTQTTSSSSTSETETTLASTTQSTADTSTFEPGPGKNDNAPTVTPNMAHSQKSLESDSLVGESQSTTHSFFGVEQTTSLNDLTTLKFDTTTTTEISQQDLNGTTEIESTKLLNESASIDPSDDSLSSTTQLSTTTNQIVTDIIQDQTSEPNVPDVSSTDASDDSMDEGPKVGSINTANDDNQNPNPTESESPSTTENEENESFDASSTQTNDLVVSTILSNNVEITPSSEKGITKSTEISDGITSTENPTGSTEPSDGLKTTTTSLLEIITTTLWPTTTDTPNKNQTENSTTSSTELTSIDSSSQTDDTSVPPTITSPSPIEVAFTNSFVEMDFEKVAANETPIVNMVIKQNVLLKVNYTGGECC